MNAPETSRRERRAAVVAVPPAVVNERDAGAYVGKSESWIRQRRFKDAQAIRDGSQPTGPAWIAVAGSILYRLVDLDSWLVANAVERGRVEWRGGDK